MTLITDHRTGLSHTITKLGYFRSPLNSYHLNTEHMNTRFIWIPDHMGVQYSNGKVTWLSQPFEFQTCWTINRLFQTTIWTPDHSITGQKFTIWIPDGIQMVTYCIRYGIPTVFWKLYSQRTDSEIETPRRRAETSFVDTSGSSVFSDIRPTESLPGDQSLTPARHVETKNGK